MIYFTIEQQTVINRFYYFIGKHDHCFDRPQFMINDRFVSIKKSVFYCIKTPKPLLKKRCYKYMRYYWEI